MTHDETAMAPPGVGASSAEISAYVAAVVAVPDGHAHGTDAGMAGEHMAALGLVPKAAATHVAIAHGDWDNPAIWHNGQVPGDGAKVLIPQGVHVDYGHVGTASVFTVRVDGHLRFADDTDSQLIVDTMVVTPKGALTIGTATDPIPADVDVRIVFADNGPIDTAWDPMLLSRGLIAHGETSIHGAVKDGHDKVSVDPMAGDTWITFDGVPQGWQVGDTIVIAGTSYEGYYHWDETLGYTPPEDEVRVITGISGNRVFFADPLDHDHDSPRADLKTSVANYTRNVTFETQNADSVAVHERGHVMFMHSDDVDVRYAAFHELGRTDKSQDAQNVTDLDTVTADANVKGRYAFHFHRTGTEDLDNPAIAIGNAVFGSPGWGFVHHDSNALLEGNATYATFGAGYVAESGNETGAWRDNIAIFSQGMNWRDPKLGHSPDAFHAFDLGRTGDGFWFQGRMVASVDNIAASVNNGFVYFHRAPAGEPEALTFDAADSPLEDALRYQENLGNSLHPILGFSGNEVFAARNGLYVLKANPTQTHDIHSVLEDFTAWQVREGADMSYTAHYVMKNFDLIGRADTPWGGPGRTGVMLGSNAFDMTFVDVRLENFNIGLDLKKNFVDPATMGTEHDFVVVNPTFIDVTNNYLNRTGADRILKTGDVPHLAPDLRLDGPLRYREGDPNAGPNWREITISGTKTDSLGITDFPSQADDFTVRWAAVIETLQEKGYYTAPDGQNYFLLDIYFSDRLTGDIYVETHPVFLDNVDVVNPLSWYGNAPFHGILDPQKATQDTAKLWAKIINGEVVKVDEIKVVGTGEADRMNGTGDADIILGQAGNDVIAAKAGRDEVSGGDGHDRINGGSGSDLLMGENGRDIIDGGRGQDIMKGGKGNDTLIGKQGDDHLEGGQDNDNLAGGAGHDTLMGGAGHDKLRGGGLDDRMFGGIGRDTLKGGNGADRLIGGDGDDTLNGESGADRLFGSNGHDRLEGGRGADRLEGGHGNDRMTGGVGDDIFVFRASHGRDTITDFTVGSDTIRLDFGNLKFRDLEIGYAKGDAVIDTGAGIIVLEDVLPRHLSYDDFSF